MRHDHPISINEEVLPISYTFSNHFVLWRKPSLDGGLVEQRSHVVRGPHPLPVTWPAQSKHKVPWQVLSGVLCWELRDVSLPWVPGAERLPWAGMVCWVKVAMSKQRKWVMREESRAEPYTKRRQGEAQTLKVWFYFSVPERVSVRPNCPSAELRKWWWFTLNSYPISSLSLEPACKSLVCKLRRADWRLHSLERLSIKCSLSSQGHYFALPSFLFAQWNNPGERYLGCHLSSF